MRFENDTHRITERRVASWNKSHDRRCSKKESINPILSGSPHPDQ